METNLQSRELEQTGHNAVLLESVGVVVNHALEHDINTRETNLSPLSPALEPTLEPTLEGLQQQLGYHFSNLELLKLALTHRSCLQDGDTPPTPAKTNQNPDKNRSPGGMPLLFNHSSLSHEQQRVRSDHNERLEYLGDAVLELAISDLLFHRYPEQPEGALSHWRSSLVNTQSLGRIGQEHQLGYFLKMGRGEILSGGRRKISLLANAMEATLGAIYLDGGYLQSYRVIQRIFATSLQEFRPGKWQKDYKSKLQEQLQGAGSPLPTYKVVTVSGAPHERTFQISCTVLQAERPDQPPITGIGIGRSKRIAEQLAAKCVLQTLEEQPRLAELNA